MWPPGKLSPWTTHRPMRPERPWVERPSQQRQGGDDVSAAQRPWSEAQNAALAVRGRGAELGGSVGQEVCTPALGASAEASEMLSYQPCEAALRDGGSSGLQRLSEEARSAGERKAS